MTLAKNAIAVAIATLFSAAAFAQTVGSEVQRDVNQQQRIESGLQSGQLTTREAAKLEKDESRINRMESQALKDGNLSAAEKARIQNAQNKASKDIYQEKHDAQVGNPNSASSKRMQADVRRNVNQEKRIEQGVQSGQLTNHEVGALERGQARVDRSEARAGRDGHVGAAEQARIQHKENVQSGRIYNKKHNDKTRG
jgi:hypothetical protein